MSKENEIAIKVDNVSKNFLLPHQRASTLKSVFINPLRRSDVEKQKALDKVSFEVKKGEFFGIVGRNGSGKSTLLKCMAGVYATDEGRIKIDGTLVPFIELGVGFNPELSGRDNVYLNGVLLGFSRQEMEVMYPEIVEFAELENFMDQKLKNYSSGMQVRLAFSIAVRAKGDILLLDEVLAVGDALFQQKCYNYFQQLKKEKKTVVLVSHDQNALRQFCTEGILIENGKLVARGAIDDIVDQYTDILSDKEQVASDKPKKAEDREHHGTGKVSIQQISMLSANGVEKSVFRETDETVTIKISFKAKEKVETPIYGITIKDAAGLKLFASNNLWTSQKSNSLDEGQVQQVEWQLPNIFNTGEYFISPAVADYGGKEIYDSLSNGGSFKVRKKLNSSAITNPEHQINIGTVK